MAGSSDYPVSHYDVLAAAKAAATRRTRLGNVCEPEQAIGVDEVLQAYTRGGAAALGIEQQAGTIEPGKRADLVVLSADPVRTDPDRIDDLAILRTYVGGQLAYEA